jgi:hypothetical protein
MIPDLAMDRAKPALPCRAKDLGDGFVLLRARDRDPHPLRECEVDALHAFWYTTASAGIPRTVSVRRWAKLRVPTIQIGHSAWKEKEKPFLKRRTAQNLKVRLKPSLIIYLAVL